jgi:hypothetical protein
MKSEDTVYKARILLPSLLFLGGARLFIAPKVDPVRRALSVSLFNRPSSLGDFNVRGWWESEDRL